MFLFPCIPALQLEAKLAGESIRNKRLTNELRLARANESGSPLSAGSVGSTGSYNGSDTNAAGATSAAIAAAVKEAVKEATAKAEAAATASLASVTAEKDAAVSDLKASRTECMEASAALAHALGPGRNAAIREAAALAKAEADAKTCSLEAALEVALKASSTAEAKVAKAEKTAAATVREAKANAEKAAKEHGQEMGALCLQLRAVQEEVGASQEREAQLRAALEEQQEQQQATEMAQQQAATEEEEDEGGAAAAQAQLQVENEALQEQLDACRAEVGAAKRAAYDAAAKSDAHEVAEGLAEVRKQPSPVVHPAFVVWCSFYEVDSPFFFQHLFCGASCGPVRKLALISDACIFLLLVFLLPFFMFVLNHFSFVVQSQELEDAKTEARDAQETHAALVEEVRLLRAALGEADANTGRLRETAAQAKHELKMLREENADAAAAAAAAAVVNLPPLAPHQLSSPFQLQQSSQAGDVAPSMEAKARAEATAEMAPSKQPKSKKAAAAEAAKAKKKAAAEAKKEATRKAAGQAAEETLAPTAMEQAIDAATSEKAATEIEEEVAAAASEDATSVAPTDETADANKVNGGGGGVEICAAAAALAEEEGMEGGGGRGGSGGGGEEVKPNKNNSRRRRRSMRLVKQQRLSLDGDDTESRGCGGKAEAAKEEPPSEAAAAAAAASFVAAAAAASQALAPTDAPEDSATAVASHVAGEQMEAPPSPNASNPAFAIPPTATESLEAALAMIAALDPTSGDAATTLAVDGGDGVDDVVGASEEVENDVDDEADGAAEGLSTTTETTMNTTTETTMASELDNSETELQEQELEKKAEEEEEEEEEEECLSPAETAHAAMLEDEEQEARQAQELQQQLEAKEEAAAAAAAEKERLLKLRQLDASRASQKNKGRRRRSGRFVDLAPKNYADDAAAEQEAEEEEEERRQQQQQLLQQQSEAVVPTAPSTDQLVEQEDNVAEELGATSGSGENPFLESSSFGGIMCWGNTGAAGGGYGDEEDMNGSVFHDEEFTFSPEDDAFGHVEREEVAVEAAEEVALEAAEKVAVEEKVIAEAEAHQDQVSTQEHSGSDSSSTLNSVDDESSGGGSGGQESVAQQQQQVQVQKQQQSSDVCSLLPSATPSSFESSSYFSSLSSAALEEAMDSLAASDVVVASQVALGACTALMWKKQQTQTQPHVMACLLLQQQQQSSNKDTVEATAAAQLLVRALFREAVGAETAVQQGYDHLLPEPKSAGKTNNNSMGRTASSACGVSAVAAATTTTTTTTTTMMNPKKKNRVKFASHDFTAVAPPVDTAEHSERATEAAVVALEKVLVAKGKLATLTFVTSDGNSSSSSSSSSALVQGGGGSRRNAKGAKKTVNPTTASSASATANTIRIGLSALLLAASALRHVASAVKQAQLMSGGGDGSSSSVGEVVLEACRAHGVSASNVEASCSLFAQEFETVDDANNDDDDDVDDASSSSRGTLFLPRPLEDDACGAMMAKQRACGPVRAKLLDLTSSALRFHLRRLLNAPPPPATTPTVVERGRENMGMFSSPTACAAASFAEHGCRSQVHLWFRFAPPPVHEGVAVSAASGGSGPSGYHGGGAAVCCDGSLGCLVAQAVEALFPYLKY
jgi:hypothetical protein